MNEYLKRLISSLVLILIFIVAYVFGFYYIISLIFLCFLISILEWSKFNIVKLYKILGYFFLIVSFYSVYKIYTSDINYFVFKLEVIILICVSTDIGGYIFGKIFKGPKISKISPNKTYSGVIGAFASSIISFFLYAYSFDLLYVFTLKNFLIILSTSAISQIGDLIISYFKRLSNFKDTGKIIPGHGGLLDRIDGMLFAFPYSYLFILING